MEMQRSIVMLEVLENNLQKAAAGELTLLPSKTGKRHESIFKDFHLQADLLLLSPQAHVPPVLFDLTLMKGFRVYLPCIYI